MVIPDHGLGLIVYSHNHPSWILSRRDHRDQYMETSAGLCCQYRQHEKTSKHKKEYQDPPAIAKLSFRT
jgi:hypothetical protein